MSRVKVSYTIDGSCSGLVVGGAHCHDITTALLQDVTPGTDHKLALVLNTYQPSL